MELFYRRRQEIWASRISPGITFEAGPPRLLVKSELLSTQTWINSPEVSADGQRFLVVRHPPRERTERLLAYVQNWIEELKRTSRSPR